MVILQGHDKRNFKYNSIAILDILNTLILDKPRIIDSLTGVATLFHTVNIGNKMLKDGFVTAVVIGIDGFKQLNDSYGHIIANNLLVEFGRMLQQKTAGLDCIVGRLGGDEFVILLKNYSTIEGLSVTDFINQEISNKTYKIDPNIEPIIIGFSIGEATTNNKSEFGIRELLLKAEANMDYYKYKNRNVLKREIHHKDVFHNQANYLLKVLAEKDMYTYVHSQYTAKYVVAIAEELGLSSDKVEKIYFAGWLHDIGKIVVTSEILRKPTRLDNFEYDIIKSHVVNGLYIITPFNFDETVQNAIRFHHERWDGKGYPYGILGEDTPIEGRILQVADAVSAILMNMSLSLKTKVNIEEEARKLGMIYPSEAKVVITEPQGEIK